MGFSRQEHCSGSPFPSLEDLPDPGIEPGSPALYADALPSEPPEKSQYMVEGRNSLFQKIHLLIRGCAESLLVHSGFLSLPQTEVPLYCGVRASHCRGF